VQMETTFTGFADRDEAGRRLAVALARYRGNPNALVLGIPRGGVVTAAAVAEELGLPVDIVGRGRHFRGELPPLDLGGKVVIVVDDGLATGRTMQAVLDTVRRFDAAYVVLAVPVAAKETLDRFRFEVDELVYLETPEPFGNIGYWYVDFTAISDDEVVRVLEKARSAAAV
jgi:putative phosphoribosyl transferase